MASIQVFLIISTCFLYLVAAGLFSRAVWDFETNKVCSQIHDRDTSDSHIVAVEQHHWRGCVRGWIRAGFV